jgi:outer membrane receptor protein involved in Fe transport
MLGGRADRIDGDVNNEAATAVVRPSGYRGATQGSPKAAVVVTPDPHVDVFANFGQGFHSNDIRTVIVGQATTLIARATGEEVGTTVRPISGLAVSAVAFLLDLTSEETIDGDTASTTPSGPTRRYGTEETLRYQFKNDVFVEGTYTYAHSRFTDAADIDAGQSFVPLAPRHTFSAAAGAFHEVAPRTTVYGSLDVRAMSDRYATQDDGTHGAPAPLIATGFCVFNGLVGVRYRMWDLGLTVINIANAVYREGQFAVQSRLPGEGPNPPEGISFTPGVPRELMATLALRWR